MSTEFKETVKTIYAQLKQLEEAVKDAEMAVKLGQSMGFDISEAQLRFERLKKQYEQMKRGLEQFARESGIML